MNSQAQTYYVVKKGHKTGIFRTWLECKSAVDGYKNPIFRKFSSFIEASEFYGNGNSNTSTLKSQTNTGEYFIQFDLSS